MFHIILYEPEIPPNTGNIVRLSANCGAHLHLIEPLGFDLSDRQVKRAGLDYHDFAKVRRYSSLQDCLQSINPTHVYGCSTKGGKSYSDIQYQAGDALLFGPETRGLPQQVLDTLGTEYVVRIPMRAESRSLNLSNAVAIIVYEAWRQQGFSGS
jgi:tRNA (cytidine/uridine-2'-O-)-methyltransferase